MHTPLANATERVETGVALREAAQKANILFGAAVAADCLCDAKYRAAISGHFSMLAPENALKWAALRPSSDVFDFAGGDAVVRLAQANGQRIRGHVLAWHAYNPAWVRKNVFSARQLGSLLHEHVETVLGHYAHEVFAWDVVNEVLADGRADSMRGSIWYDRPGIGFAGAGARYVEEIFRWARAANPSTRLFYNDDPCATTTRGDEMFRLLTDLLLRGAPVDGVGLQLHLDLSSNLSQLEENLEKLAELGLEIHVTELDVAIPIDSAGRPIDDDHLRVQADIYERVVTLCVRQLRCTAIQTWGVDDGHSWIPTFSRGALGGALLLDECYAAKPSYDATVAALTGAIEIRSREGQRR